jgi:hypothetical protein
MPDERFLTPIDFERGKAFGGEAATSGSNAQPSKSTTGPNKGAANAEQSEPKVRRYNMETGKFE